MKKAITLSLKERREAAFRADPRVQELLAAAKDGYFPPLFQLITDQLLGEYGLHEGLKKPSCIKKVKFPNVVINNENKSTKSLPRKVDYRTVGAFLVR